MLFTPQRSYASTPVPYHHRKHTTAVRIPAFLPSPVTPKMPDPRDHRDMRDHRDPRDMRDMRDPRDMRDMREREMRDPREMREMRDPRELAMREMRDPRDMRDMREPHPREMRDPRDMRERVDPRERDPRDHRDPRERDPRMHPSHHPVSHHPSYAHSAHPAHPSHASHPSHSSHPIHPSHASHPSLSHPSHPPGPSYVTQHPPYHHSSRHTNGQPTGLGIHAPPPGMVMSAPEAGIPQMSNGHSHGIPSLPHGHPREHHTMPPPPTMAPATARAKEKMDHLLGNLASANENTWLLMGAVAEQMQDTERAMSAFDNALRHNPNSIIALTSAANIARNKDQFDKAIEYFQRVLNIKQDNGEVWGSMGHCLLMKDDLPKAYTAYQQALYHLQNPKEPKLWYGIGILYDRYGSFEHAEEAFSSVLKMDPNFEKANEIYFRLGIIYKHQRKYSASLECFRYILDNPPRPLTHFDIWFQLGHVYEQDRDFENAKDAYMRVLTHQPDHAKVLQQLGWLYHQPGAAFADQEKAVQYLTKSLETDGSDAQSWYLLGRAFMAGQRYNKAYEAYQQAVYRDGRNPTFWCSIGVLYYQINQYRDALDAYSRAIRLNPYIPEVWYNLGSLYESCNNQVTDAIDAYSRAAELDPSNSTIKSRLSLLQGAGSKNAPLPPAPGPVDVHPSQYAATPTNANYQAGSPRASPHAGQVPDVRQDGAPRRGSIQAGDRAMLSPGPFRGGIAPPPLNQVDETRGSMSRHAPLAPIEIERPDAPTRPDPREPASHPPNGRAEDRSRDRRRPPSPGSPRRQVPADAGREYGYPAQAAPHGRDREPRSREEWEARERERRGERGPPPQLVPGQPMDPRGPSPRMLERQPGPHQMDSRRHPSPRVPSDPRDPRDMRGEHRAEPPYPYSPYDERDRRRHEDTVPPSALGAPRHPSSSHELRPEERVPSPAPSNSSRASKRARDSAGLGPAKRAKEDKNGSGGRRATGDKRKDRRGAGSPTEEAKTQQRPVDEDYDEGVDALMALHGDRPSNASVRASSAASSTLPAVRSPPGESASASASASMTAVALEGGAAGIKRADPASPRSPNTVTAKKPKSAAESGSSNGASPGLSPSATTLTSGKKTTSIEVLNAERIKSPTTTPAPASVSVPAPTSDANADKSAISTEPTEAERQNIAAPAAQPEASGTTSTADVDMADVAAPAAPAVQSTVSPAAVPAPAEEAIQPEQDTIMAAATSAPATPPLPEPPVHSQAGEAVPAAAAEATGEEDVTMAESTPPTSVAAAAAAVAAQAPPAPAEQQTEVPAPDIPAPPPTEVVKTPPPVDAAIETASVQPTGEKSADEMVPA